MFGNSGNTVLCFNDATLHVLQSALRDSAANTAVLVAIGHVCGDDHLHSGWNNFGHDRWIYMDDTAIHSLDQHWAVRCDILLIRMHQFVIVGMSIKQQTAVMAGAARSLAYWAEGIHCALARTDAA